MNAVALAKRTWTPYIVVSLIVGAQGAIESYTHTFGGGHAASVVGAILQGWALIAVVGQAALSSTTFAIPGPIYAVLMRADTVLLVLGGASAEILQWSGAFHSSLATLIGAAVLQGFVLLGALLQQFLQSPVGSAIRERLLHPLAVVQIGPVSTGGTAPYHHEVASGGNLDG